MVAQQDLLDKRSWWSTPEISCISVSYVVEPPCDFEPEEHCYGMGKLVTRFRTRRHERVPSRMQDPLLRLDWNHLLSILLHPL